MLGTYVTFYALIYFGQWRVVSLMPGLSCIRASGEGDDRTALYNAFPAASVLLAYIKGEAMRLVCSPPPPIEGNRSLPPILSLRHPHSDTRVRFKILKLFPSRAPDQHHYIAETIEGTEIMVKFSRRYS